MHDERSTTTSNPDSSIESIDEEMDYSSKRHLAIVFFDILHLNGRDMTDVPLCKRRKVLEKTIRTVPQFVRVTEHAMASSYTTLEHAVAF